MVKKTKNYKMFGVLIILILNFNFVFADDFNDTSPLTGEVITTNVLNDSSPRDSIDSFKRANFLLVFVIVLILLYLGIRYLRIGGARNNSVERGIE